MSINDSFSKKKRKKLWIRDKRKKIYQKNELYEYNRTYMNCLKVLGYLTHIYHFIEELIDVNYVQTFFFFRLNISFFTIF